MMILAPCPHCFNRTAQLLEWHGGVPEDHTRYTCQTCNVTWDVYEPDEECGLCGKDPADGLAKIDGIRYCHGDKDPRLTCWTQVRYRTTITITPDTELTESDA